MVNISAPQQESTPESSQTQASSSRQVDQDNRDRARHLPRQAIETASTIPFNALALNSKVAANINQQPPHDRSETNEKYSFVRKLTSEYPLLITSKTDEKQYIEILKSEANTDLAKAKNIYGKSLLNQAITCNKNQIVSYLLELEKFDLEQVNLRLTPLMAAAYVNNIQACKLLIKAGATIGQLVSNDDSDKAITKALQNEDKTNELANYLISMLPENEKQNIVNQELRIAASQGKLDSVKFLLNNHQADLFSRNSDYGIAMSNASWFHHHDVVEFLLEQTIQQLNKIATNEGEQAKNTKAADIAGALARDGRLPDLINFMEKAQLNVNQKDPDGETILFMATSWNRLEIVKYLAEQKNASVSLLSNGWSAASNAARYSRLEVMDCLLNQSDFRALPEQAQECFMAAAKAGKNATLTHLMANYPVDINGTNNNNRTALHLACRYNQFDTVKFLVENNSTTLPILGVTNWGNSSPIEIASQYGNAKIVDYLINSSTSEADRERCIEAAFEASAKSDNVEFVKSLYEKYRGTIDSSDMVPVKYALFIASDRGQLDIIKYLVSQNADIDQEFDDVNLIQNSLDENQDQIVEYLLTQYSGEARKQTALELAFRAISKHDTVTPLFEHLVMNEGININEEMGRLTLFDKAVKRGRINHIQFLIKNGSEITLKRLRKCDNIEVFKFILKNIPPEDVAKIGRPTALSDEATQEEILTWMILRAGANNNQTDQTQMYKSINYDYNQESESSSDDEEYACKNSHMPAGFVAGRSQALLEGLEEAIISGDSNVFNIALTQIEKSGYSQDILNFGYYSLNRAAYISLTRTFVNEDIIVNLIAMGANPKEILETENDLKHNTRESISESAHQFLEEIEDRSQYENEAALLNKIKESYQSHFATTLNHHKRSADILITDNTVNPAKQVRTNENN